MDLSLDDTIMNEDKLLAIRYRNRRRRTLRVGGAFLLALIAAGCSGLNASKSISPLDFFLPGLLQNHPASPVIPFETNGVALLAQGSHLPQ